MKTNEEVIYQIIKKNIILIILVPCLIVGAYFGYERLGGKVSYQTKTTVFINSKEDLFEKDGVEKYQKLTSSFGEIAVSSIVLDKASDKLNKKYSANDIYKMISVETKTYSQSIQIQLTSNSADNLVETANAVTSSLKETAVELFGHNLVTVIDTPSEVSAQYASIGKTKLIGVFGISFVVVLFLFIGLNWKKEKNSSKK